MIKKALKKYILYDSIYIKSWEVPADLQWQEEDSCKETSEKNGREEVKKDMGKLSDTVDAFAGLAEVMVAWVHTWQNSPDPML